MNFTRLAGSISQGLSTGLSTAYEAGRATKNWVVAATVGGFAFFADTVSTWNFQGSALVKQQNPPEIRAKEGLEALLGDEAPIPAIPEPVSSRPRAYTGAHAYQTEIDSHTLSISQAINNAQPDTETPPPPRVNWSGIRQKLYLGLDAGKNLSNRYFLLMNLMLLFDRDPDGAAFYTTLALSFAVKQIFACSNETYENVAKLAKKNPPFYKGFYDYFFSSPRSRQALRVVGSLDHTIMEGLLPWLLFLPKSLVEQFKSKEKEGINAIIVASVISVLPALLIFAQAYYFEGRHTIKNLAREDLHASKDLSMLPNCALSVLRQTTLLMGPFHGAVTTTNVFLVLDKMLEKDIRWVSIICGIAAGVAFAGLINASEVGEVRGLFTDEIHRRGQLSIEPATGVVQTPAAGKEPKPDDWEEDVFEGDASILGGSSTTSRVGVC